jgi:predicted site-specific integrase-resolvase
MQIMETHDPTPGRAHSIKAVAKALTLCERTVRGLIAEGKIKAPLVSKRRRIVTDTELRRLLEEGIQD